jgi:hypothetical protein
MSNVTLTDPDSLQRIIAEMRDVARFGTLFGRENGGGEAALRIWADRLAALPPAAAPPHATELAALHAIVKADQLYGYTATSGGAAVWHDGPCAEIARAAVVATHDGIQVIRREGADAFNAGVDRSRNPYQFNKAKWWDDGYLSASNAHNQRRNNDDDAHEDTVDGPSA